jgi:hypothetical protein
VNGWGRARGGVASGGDTYGSERSRGACSGSGRAPEIDDGAWAGSSGGGAIVVNDSESLWDSTSSGIACARGAATWANC